MFLLKNKKNIKRFYNYDVNISTRICYIHAINTGV